MIPLEKLAKLAPRHRMRKIALVLGQLEKELLAHPEGPGGSLGPYLSGLAGLLLREGEASEGAGAAAARLAAASGAGGEELLRALDALRHALLTATGQAPADWDLIDPATGQLDPRARRVIPGLRAYLEDLRSPFNVGSIFRTADAFGVEELILSPSCADPLHLRAQRSAMGAIDLVPWRREALAALPGASPGASPSAPQIFALELGGTPIEDFSFPAEGIAIIGSEELGISREARELCKCGTVSIGMSGAKASLNVAVAFGILMHEWSRSV